MENKNINYNSRMLINELLIEPEISKLMKKLKEKRYEVFLHSLNVAYLTCEVFFKCSKRLSSKYDEQYIKDTVTGALLHDIGKIKISNRVLLKKGKLNELERNEINKHTLYGYEMVKDNPYFSDLTKEIILSHHEKIDGSGYPNKKKKKELKYGVRLVTVIDMFDALTEERAYREKNITCEALKILYDAPVDIDAFIYLASCSDL